MRRKYNDERGFTLIEMMIVLLIISMLILIAIPNVTKHSQSIDSKGCNAYIRMVQGQVEAYKMDNKGKEITFTNLIKDSYLPEEGEKCPDGTKLTITAEGAVQMMDDE